MAPLIKLIALDWEGCVTEPGGSVTPWDMLRMAKLAETIRMLPIPVIIVTGRQGPYVEAGIQAINALGREIYQVPSVCENGALLYYPLTRGYEFNPALNSAQIEGARNLSLQVRKWAESQTKFRAALTAGKEVCVSIVVLPPENLASALEAFREEFQSIKLDFEVTASKSAIDITPRGVNKWSGLSYVLRKTKIQPAQVLGIGDAENDLIWLSRIGVPCCPANADGAIKQLAKYVAKEKTTAGVIEILQWAQLP